MMKTNCPRHPQFELTYLPFVEPTFSRILRSTTTWLALAICSIYPLCSNAAAQSLPKEIRGYKVYNAKIDAFSQTDLPISEKSNKAVVRIGNFSISGIGLTGVTLKANVSFRTAFTGTVDFMTFRDFTIDELPIEIAEYKSGFAFERDRQMELPEPLQINIGTTTAVKAAFHELTGAKKDWRLNGIVFVFGKFKKFGWTFKRVIPVNVTVQIQNPWFGR